MRNFLKELYFGNLDQQARGYPKNSHILKVSKNINELEEKLTQRLNDEEKKLFLDYIGNLCHYLVIFTDLVMDGIHEDKRIVDF